MSPPPQRPDRLPDRARAIALLCLVLAGLVGLLAASEAFGLLGLSEARKVEVSGFGMLDPQIWKRAFDAQLSALESMRDARLLVLTALAIASALTFSATARLLWPGGLPREGMRQLLGVSALVAAVARTLDGAQLAVVHRKYGLGLQQAILEDPKLRGEPGMESLAAVMPTASLAFAVVTTFLVAGAFLLFSSYFRSEKVKQWVALGDQHL